jgi:type IV pilus assembly protein PilZ
MFKDRASFIKAQAGNISKGGMFIRTKKPLGRGEQFVLKLQLPDLPDPMEIACQVAWMRGPSEESEQSPAGMGIQFRDMSPEMKKTLDRYVESTDG